MISSSCGQNIFDSNQKVLLGYAHIWNKAYVSQICLL